MLNQFFKWLLISPCQVGLPEVSFSLSDSRDLERMAKTGYRYILVDTCFIVEEIDSLPRLCEPSFIRVSGKVPSLCDFTYKEFRSVSGSSAGEITIMHKILRGCSLARRSYTLGMGEVWKKYHRIISSGGVVVRLITGATCREDINRLVDMLDKGYRRVILRHYSGCKSRSNPYDLALAAIAVLLVSSGVKSGVATKDRRLLKLINNLREKCDLDLEAWDIPWLNQDQLKVEH